MQTRDRNHDSSPRKQPEFPWPEDICVRVGKTAGDGNDDDDDDEPATMAHLCARYLFLRSAIAQAVIASNTFLEEAYIGTCPGTRSPALSRRDPC